MSRLQPCPACGRHVRVSEARCRFCATALATAAGPSKLSLALLGLCLAACTSGGGDKPKPDASKTDASKTDSSKADADKADPTPTTTAAEAGADAGADAGAAGTDTGEAIEDPPPEPTPKPRHPTKYGAPRRPDGPVGPDGLPEL